MAAIWIILLDVSGSMGEGFSGEAQQAEAIAETGRWSTKLEAAKEILIRQVHATRGQDIAVITFSTHARRIFKGTLSDFQLWESEVYKLQPENRTNLAEALHLATGDKDYETYDAISILVITDGLSNEGEPESTAKEFITKYPHGRIDTILIDETKEGRFVAESVSINGWVRPAYSLLQLESAVTFGRAVSFHQALSGISEQRYAIEYALAEATNQRLPVQMILTSPPAFEITPATLANDIVPVLLAIEGIQRTACDIHGVPYEGRLSSISKSSPVSITVSGFEKVVLRFLTFISQWRSDHAQTMAKLKEEKLKAEIEKIHSETAESFARAAKIGAEADQIELEAKIRRKEAEVMELDRRKRELELVQKKLYLANVIFWKLSGDESNMNNMDRDRKDAYVQQLLHAVDLLVENRLEFDMQWHPRENNQSR